jgi:Leucine-rich repeat (LRR) protein
MSDNEEPEQQNPDGAPVEAEPEDPRTIIKPETIVEGLSKV